MKTDQKSDKGESRVGSDAGLARCGYSRTKRFIWQLYATIGGREYIVHMWHSKRPSRKEVQKQMERNWSDATGFRLAEGSTVTRGKWKRANAEVSHGDRDRKPDANPTHKQP